VQGLKQKGSRLFFFIGLSHSSYLVVKLALHAQSVTTGFPRRSFLALLASKAVASSLPAPTWRHYRIDATITAFGATIFSRRHVGEAMATFQVTESSEGRQVNFSFMGASLPERTRGILQLGHFEEELRESQGRLASSRYFGFLTAAPEGEKKVPKGPMPTCCAVDGSLDAARFRFRKTYEAKLPTTACFQELPKLRREMKQSLNDICANTCMNGNSQPAAGRTFLKTLIDAVESRGNQMEADYHYGDRVLRFRAKKAPADAGLASLDAEVQGRGRHRFAFYYRPATPVALPEKVEYWPRPWLRLTLSPQDDRPSKEKT
jgi:hypothetical protein